MRTGVSGIGQEGASFTMASTVPSTIIGQTVVDFVRSFFMERTGQAFFCYIVVQHMLAAVLQDAWRQGGFGLVELGLVVSTSPREETATANCSLTPASVR